VTLSPSHWTGAAPSEEDGLRQSISLGIGEDLGGT
jgi:hypothetical protein